MNPQEWISLRDHFDSLWTEREKRLDERWRSQELALTKATNELEERLQLLNELRSNVLSREEYDGKHESLTAEIARNKSEMDALRGLQATDMQRIRGEYMSKNDHSVFETQLHDLQTWRSNIMGRAVAVALIGGVIIAGLSALFYHLATS